MKTADTDWKSGGKEQLRQIDSPGKLIGLNANETNESLTTRPENQFDDLIRSDTPIGLIVGMKTYFYTCTQHCARARIFGQAVQAGQRVGWDSRPNPLNGIAVIIVVGRLDQNDMQQPLRSRRRDISGTTIHR